LALVSGTAEGDWAAVAHVTTLNPGITPSFGCHPWFFHQRTAHWQDALTGWLDGTPRGVIGELGLDRRILDQSPGIRGHDWIVAS